jgi:type I restriction enzyme R subunit
LRIKHINTSIVSDINRLSDITCGNCTTSSNVFAYRVITRDIPERVSADVAYQNARKNSDKQNARIELNKALQRVMNDVLNDDTELFKQFSNNDSFKNWLENTVFDATYEQSVPK